VQSPVTQGAYAAQLQLTTDAVWPNGLKRVELQHTPAAGRTGEGKETFFAWSFYLPATLAESPAQTIGYWESAASYQQVMGFDVKGSDITFFTRMPANTVVWDAKGAATAGAWHRIAMRILWSTSPATGRVDVWFDGAQVVTGAAAQTRADGNELFTQIGLLRGAVEFADSPIIVIDDAVEGESLADVRPQGASTPADAGAGNGDARLSPGPKGGTPPPPAGPGGDAGASAPSAAEAQSTSDGGCSTSGARDPAWLLALGAAAAAIQAQRSRVRR
jgi:hypothetical protein